MSGNGENGKCFEKNGATFGISVIQGKTYFARRNEWVVGMRSESTKKETGSFKDPRQDKNAIVIIHTVFT